MKESNKNKIIIFLSIILVFILVSFGMYIIYNFEKADIESERFVIEVIDGDTFRMNSGEIIRLLCVNTPEKNEKDYERAKKFLESLILYKDVEIIKSESFENKDKYDRELGYVYVNNNKRIFVNKLIIEAGFSEIYDYKDSEGVCRKRLKE